MKELVFGSQKELYERILPALRSKKSMLSRNGNKGIKEIEIWDYMRTQKWINSYGLELCDMVDDILNTKNELIVEYLLNKNNVVNIESDKIVNDEIDLPKLKI